MTLTDEQIENLPREILIELVHALMREIALLRAQPEELRRKANSRPASSNKSKRKKNPKPPGHKRGQGSWRRLSAQSEEEYSQNLIDVPITQRACPDGGGLLTDDGQEIVTETEVPPMPKPIIKAYQVHMCKCSGCGKRLRGLHPEVAADQQGATTRRLGLRAQAAAHLLHYQIGVPLRKVPEVL